MTNAAILELDGAGKSYRSFASMWWRAAGWVSGTPTHFTDHWVLRDVSLRMGAGESIGIVGRNGAGKSTLLKLIAGTLVPTEGRVAIRASVSALLELGMGFNPEFTGRENAAHVCGLLGLDGAEIGELLPWIESFADVGTYFDQPMRTYSSGMYVRVAFAVATAKRPDILIVDEALSVGDAAFQRKSFRRIEDFLAMGTSLLFVSHGTESVKRICDKGVWLDRGRVRLFGSSKEACDAYEQESLTGLIAPLTAPKVGARAYNDVGLESSIETQYGDRQARIVDVTIAVDGSLRANTIPEGQPFSIAYKVEFLTECRDVCFGTMVKTVDGICVYATNTAVSHSANLYRPGDAVQVRFEFDNNLLPGIYYLNCGVNRQTEEGRTLLHRRVDTEIFRILSVRESPDSGLCHLRGRAHLKALAVGPAR